MNHNYETLDLGLKKLWPLDPKIIFLNHGSFGACPTSVIEQQQTLRLEMEREPVRFLHRQLPERLESSRQQLALFLGVKPSNLVFVPNATHGVNTILHSIPWKTNDEIVISNQGYRACRNAVESIAQKHHLKIRTVKLPFPNITPMLVVEKVIEALSPLTRLVLLDHITSGTGLILPIKEISRELAKRDIDFLVDGAHSAGSIAVNLEDLGVTYYTTNAHKWLCAPKGAACLYVANHRIEQVRPLCISHAPSLASEPSQLFKMSFDWTGTYDPTAYLMIPYAINYLSSLMVGGWSTIFQRNRQLAHQGRDLLCKTLEIEVPCPDEMFATLATIPLPLKIDAPPPEIHPLQERLFDRWNIEIPIIPNPQMGCYMIRLSAFVYNHLEEYQRLSESLHQELRKDFSH